ncbi:MAG: hypothetical protein C3F13_10430 [Anaerolineales bacterium]|nr:ArsR family transcriptional regulator [Anaerolineae bacterium]PWB53027.1 MAG: hypothetical protein C3F13_10430 [Anaerolineales bacterium]
MSNARQKILGYIEEHHSATVDELSRVFKVTPANIRHHLSILVDQDSLEIIGVKPSGNKGRPTQIYRSAAQVRLNNLESLTEILLGDFLQGITEDERERLLRRIANQLAASFTLEKNNPTRRIYACMRVLNHLNYQAHWEAHIDNPRIILDHCPYQALRTHHPELCQMDSYLLETLLDAPIKQTERLSSTPKGLQQCVFALSRPTG